MQITVPERTKRKIHRLYPSRDELDKSEGTGCSNGVTVMQGNSSMNHIWLR